MRKRYGFVACLAVLAVFAGAGAQDGLPDLTGTWTGTAKGKASALDPGGPTIPVGDEFTADFSQSGPVLSVTLGIGSDPTDDLAGSTGNRTFWAVNADPTAPVVAVGHTDASGTRFKGSALRGSALSTLDLKFKGSR